MRTERARNSSGYLFPKFFFSITQYPYFWVFGKQGAVQSADLERAVNIADRFEISREAALRRYVELHHEVLAVVFSQNGRIRYSHRQDRFPWIQLTRGDEIGETPGASNNGDPVASLDEVDSGSWLQNGGNWQLFAQNLFQSDGYAATMLLAEPRTEEDPDEPRFF